MFAAPTKWQEPRLFLTWRPVCTPLVPRRGSALPKPGQRQKRRSRRGSSAFVSAHDTGLLTGMLTLWKGPSCGAAPVSPARPVTLPAAPRGRRPHKEQVEHPGPANPVGAACGAQRRGLRGPTPGGVKLCHAPCLSQHSSVPSSGDFPLAWWRKTGISVRGCQLLGFRRLSLA